jgi:hypothetical protein
LGSILPGGKLACLVLAQRFDNAGEGLSVQIVVDPSAVLFRLYQTSIDQNLHVMTYGWLGKTQVFLEVAGADHTVPRAATVHWVAKELDNLETIRVSQRS